MVYSNLEQRMAQSFIDLFPAFVPDDNAPVSVREQEHFHVLIKTLYQLAFDEPLLFVTALHEDDAYPTRYKKAYGKPKLIADMRKFIKAVTGMLEKMFLMGQGSDAAMNKRELVILSKLGIDDYSKLPAAWVWMSTRDDANVGAFTYCLFRKDYSYSADVYARLLGEEVFRKLEHWMIGNGYKHFDIYKTTASECKLSLTIANPKWSGSSPSGGCEYGIRHTGISVMYDYYVQDPVILGLCIPNGLKSFLEAFGTMDNALQKFIVSRTKKCDACRYCVQTDKTGSRPLACISVNYEGMDYQLCPYFPGYNYAWTHIDDSLVDALERMLTFMDGFAPML